MKRTIIPIVSILLVCSFLVGLVLVSYPVYSDESLVGGDLIVGYYGRPGAPRLGILGQHPIEQLTPLIQAKADVYDQLNGDHGVMPAFHLIYGMAAADPGWDKDYLIPLSHDKVMAYINAAKDSGFIVFIDTQLGANTPVGAIQPILKYLGYDNVHLAIDPEFEVNGLDVRPGKVIGHVTGQQVNEVQAAMSGYLKENGVEGNKFLIVHSFTEKMVRNKDAIKSVDQVKLILNLDGHGSPALKVKIYNDIYTAEDPEMGIAGGFKLFFQEDKPGMMTPRQVLGMDPVGESEIKFRPGYINYQ